MARMCLEVIYWEMISWFSCPSKLLRFYGSLPDPGIGLRLRNWEMIRTVCPQQAVKNLQELETWGLLSRGYLRNDVFFAVWTFNDTYPKEDSNIYQRIFQFRDKEKNWASLFFAAELLPSEGSYIPNLIGRNPWKSKCEFESVGQ